ncbi:MAG: response regulator transcription factor [Anaerolineales bacterium]|nr:response regulator transcription factor [Anaerolineales bacterium]
MREKIRVLILEDHQAIVDGYYYRLGQSKDFAIVGALTFGEQLMPTLKEQPVDVLLLDVLAPLSKENRTPYPLFSYLKELREQRPDLKILIISMHGERTLIKAALDAGVNGYILKDDQKAIQSLGNIIRSIVDGGSYLSEQVRRILYESAPLPIVLSPRQLQILSACAAYPHLSQAEIGQMLHLQHSTVRNSLSSIYERLEVRSLREAITKARALGIITPNPPRYVTDEVDESDFTP